MKKSKILLAVRDKDSDNWSEACGQGKFVGIMAVLKHFNTTMHIKEFTINMDRGTISGMKILDN